MPLRRISQELKTRFAFSMIFLFVQPDASAVDTSVQQIGGVMIPQAFSQALQDGMSVPLYIHLAGSQGTQDDQRIGSAFIWLDGSQLRIRQIQLEERDDNASVSEKTRQQLTRLANVPFSEALTITLTDNAQLDLSLRQLLLQLVVKREALGTVLRSRSEDIGQSSVNAVSSNLTYNLGVYNNQMRNGGSNTSSYLSLNNVTALREHHVMLDGSLYGIGSGQQDSELYKAMYERDFAGHRFAGGMLDTWNLQSLGPMTAISAGKIYGLSWGNQASSTVFDSSQSTTPVVAFLPAAGEVHLLRDGRLLSVQNFAMGSYEVDTRGLPYGIYDVEVEVIVNGRVVSKRTQRVNKLFSRGRGVGSPLAWQVWGGSFHMDRWSESGKKTRPAKESWLAGVSASGSLDTLSWAATGYGYDNQAVGETRVTLPLTESVNVNLQNMLASDSSWSSIGSISATLPGGFSSLWVNQEKTRIGDQLRRSNADNRAIGGTLNLNALWSNLGTFTISYNDDRRYNSHYYTADYYQTVYSGTFGSLGLRAGIQRFNNGSSNTNTGKYVALDLSLPLGNWFSAGMTHQNGYTMANLSARKQFDEGTIRTIGANVSRAISGDTGDDKTLSGGGYAQFDARYASGTLNVNSAADGYVNTNLTASGSAGWQGKNLAASGRTDGNAGVILNTGLDDDGQISAKVNGRIYALSGKRNYLPLSPYGRYEVELQNSKNSLDSYDIVSGRKSHLTLYPGNVAVIEPEVKQMVTVSGRIRAEDGTLMANARINNHIGRTRTDENGEFVMDVDKKYPTIDFNYGGNKTCEVALELSNARGAIWVGDVVCTGLSTYARTQQTGEGNES
ncbi:CS1-pili formation C-terminal domain-containing protein [Enterobacter hormaechei subsp. steigerwaltii]|uniref:CS1-pili formation C-terminal domain-containing protein n=1 Tax=Enterobacter hormaechei TaxID=158836 RepID=UPI003F43335B